MTELKLYMLLLGCRPKGRLTEQHDIFFGIGNNLKDLVPNIKSFWPDVKGNIHIDAWREVTQIEGYSITIIEKSKDKVTSGTVNNELKQKLFFINLGGYKENEFDEFHYKFLIVAQDLGEAIKQSKQTAFYKHTGFKGAPSHIDDKFGVDVDDMFAVEDILPAFFKEKYSIILIPQAKAVDIMHLGYLPLHKIK